jgi:hypothetical protein
VHYVHLDVTPEEVDRFVAEPVSVAITHENYAYATELPPATKESLRNDLRG